MWRISSRCLSEGTGKYASRKSYREKYATAPKYRNGGEHVPFSLYRLLFASGYKRSSDCGQIGARRVFVLTSRAHYVAGLSYDSQSRGYIGRDCFFVLEGIQVGSV